LMLVLVARMVSCRKLTRLSFLCDCSKGQFFLPGRASAGCTNRKKERHLDPLEISILKYGDVEAITLKGALVLGVAVNNLRQKIDNLAAHGGHQFVFNLTGVNRMDSSGIGLLVMILSSTKEAGGSLKLVNPSKQVAQTLKMCNLLALFEVYSEEQEAISSFG